MKGFLAVLHTLTPMHPGAGTRLAYVDLPIQREKVTEFPVVQASTVKGCIRDAIFESVRGGGNKKDKVDFAWIFGAGEDVKILAEEDSEIEEELKRRLRDLLGQGSGEQKDEEQGSENQKGIEPSDFPSRVSFTDARILFFPVRSLKGVIAWVTCPMVIKRFARDAALVGCKDGLFAFQGEIPLGDKEEILLEKDTELVFNGHVVLEDFVFTGDKVKKESILGGNFKGFLPGSMNAEWFRKRVVVVHDDVFKDLTKIGTEIINRIRIDKNKGTVAEGALWAEEHIPPETMFYFLVFGDDESSVEFVKGRIDSKVVVFGGDETTGKGIAKIKVV